MKKYYNNECFFLEEELWMEGLMRFCLNSNVCKQSDYENVFHDCTDCPYFVSKRELLKEIIERQKRGMQNEI